MLEQEGICDNFIKSRPVIAVTMATSRQRIGVVNEPRRTNKYKIRAITRNPRTIKALELASLNNVKVVKGDLLDQSSLNKAFSGVDVIFGNTTPTWGWKIFSGSIDRSYEIQQGLI